MAFQHYLARQLSSPSGIVGKVVLGRLWNRRNAALNEATLAQMDLREDDRVLDIGFGGGFLLGKAIATVKRGRVAGLDASPVMVENCRARYRDEIKDGRVDIRCGRVETVPYPDGHFSTVSSVNSIFYWRDARQGIAEIYRILENRGRLVLTFTCQKDLESKGFVQHGVKTYSEEEVRQMLADAGFQDIQMTRGRDRHREFVCMTGWK